MTVQNTMYYKTCYNSPIGDITLVCDEKENLVGLWMQGQKYFENIVDSELFKTSELETFKRAKLWLDGYFRGEKPEISILPLAPKGNVFRKMVWQILCEIPYGKVCTYGEIAKIIAKKQGKTRMSAQAVGGAVAHNPISIIIPCHRVVGSNGSLTGYSGGIKRKIKLLELEGVDMSGLFVPRCSTAL